MHLRQILPDNDEPGTDAPLRYDTKCRQAGSLIVHTLLVQHLAYSHTDNGKVESNRPPMQILIIELYLGRDRQLITPVNLGPSGQSGH